MRTTTTLAGLLILASAAPALATPCADEIATLQRRLDSAGAAQVTGTVPPGGPTSSHSPKALDQAPNVKPSDPNAKPTASGVEEARKLVEKARAEDKAGKADACRDTILQAKEKAGALP